jgi:NNP family nitrate/nitrite transporter-like MFS transporter
VSFLAFYAVCFAVTWAVYLRGQAAAPAESVQAEAKPQLGYAQV